jgi:hypothetical protein
MAKASAYSKGNSKSNGSKSKGTTRTIKQKASRKAFKQNVETKMRQGKTREQAVKESQAIQQRNK